MYVLRQKRERERERERESRKEGILNDTLLEGVTDTNLSC